tara:strand:- start:46 stop:624 length:579 start_codon:yes stop_codon:yes gene_type:complete
MYVIKNDSDAIVADGKGRQSFQSLAVVFRPDGGQTTNAKVGEGLHDDDGKKLFIREVVTQLKPDDRFYTSTMKVDGSWNSTARALDDVKKTVNGKEIVTPGLKSNWISRTKTTARERLSPTDWQVIAKAERDRAIDSDAATYRAAVISKCAEIETAIQACSDLDAFKKLFEMPVDKDGNSTGNPPIHDWPDS